MHTPRRVLAFFVATLVWAIVVIATSQDDLPLFIGLFAVYFLGVFTYGVWRSHAMTAARVQRRVRRPGDEVAVRIGYLGWSLRAWDPSTPLGPRNGVRGAGYGTYRQSETGDVTLTWRPAGGGVRELTGPRVALPARRANTRRARRLVMTMSILYVAILAVVGAAVGLATRNAAEGAIAVCIAVCVMPIAVSVLRTTRLHAKSTGDQ